MPYQNENEAYVGLLCSHLRQMTRRLRLMPEEKWDWTPNVAAPTARILATHAWQWLICDRQHIAEPDALQHPGVPEPPQDPEAMCNALAEETDRWEKLILGLTPEELAADRRQFNGYPMNVRDFVGHMIQNVIYKHGQLATLFFALGLDGTEPYDAPFPNPIYEVLHKSEPVRRERIGESIAEFRRAFAGEDISPAVVDLTYDVLSEKIARGIPVRPEDTLESVFLLAQPASHLKTYGIPVRHLVEHIVLESGGAAPASEHDLSAVVTAADLVRAAAKALRTAESETADTDK